MCECLYVYESCLLVSNEGELCNADAAVSAVLNNCLQGLESSNVELQQQVLTA